MKEKQTMLSFGAGFGTKRGWRAQGHYCITSKTDTEKFKTGLLLGFLDGKAYICSESLSGKIIVEDYCRGL